MAVGYKSLLARWVGGAGFASTGEPPAQITVTTDYIYSLDNFSTLLFNKTSSTDAVYTFTLPKQTSVDTKQNLTQNLTPNIDGISSYNSLFILPSDGLLNNNYTKLLDIDNQRITANTSIINNDYGMVITTIPTINLDALLSVNYLKELNYNYTSILSKNVGYAVDNRLTAGYIFGTPHAHNFLFTLLCGIPTDTYTQFYRTIPISYSYLFTLAANNILPIDFDATISATPISVNHVLVYDYIKTFNHTSIFPVCYLGNAHTLSHINISNLSNLVYLPSIYIDYLSHITTFIDYNIESLYNLTKLSSTTYELLQNIVRTSVLANNLSRLSSLIYTYNFDITQTILDNKSTIIENIYNLIYNKNFVLDSMSNIDILQGLNLAHTNRINHFKYIPIEHLLNIEHSRIVTLDWDYILLSTNPIVRQDGVYLVDTNNSIGIQVGIPRIFLVRTNNAIINVLSNANTYRTIKNN